MKNLIFKGLNGPFKIATATQYITQIKDSTKNTTETFAEANAHDKVWGTGLTMRDDRIFNGNEWQGHNWLGCILTELRDKFKNA